jgi:hypothetical protein
MELENGTDTNVVLSQPIVVDSDCECLLTLLAVQRNADYQVRKRHARQNKEIIA